MEIIDCHAHLADSEFDKDIEEVIQRAILNDVKQAILVTENVNNFERALDLQKRFSHFIRLCLGVHPVQLTDSSSVLSAFLQEGDSGKSRSVTQHDLDLALPIIENNIDKLFGIGEVGLDYTPHHCPTDECREIQRKVFQKQIELAKKYDLPVNVHSRSAGHYAIELLRESGITRAHLHAFNGKPHYALQGVQYGFYFSIPPEVVRCDQKAKLVKQIPLDHLLIETDSPVLGVEKEVRNEPGAAKVVVEYIAEVKGLDVATVAQITTENAKKVYSKLSKIL